MWDSVMAEIWAEIPLFDRSLYLVPVWLAFKGVKFGVDGAEILTTGLPTADTNLREEK